MARMKVRSAGAWVDTNRSGKVVYQGSDLAYGPPVAGNDPLSLFTTQTPAGSFEDGIQMSLGAVMGFSVAGHITHVRWYCPASAPTGTVYAAVFGMDETRLTAEPDATFPALPAATWITAELRNPVVISTPGQRVIGIKTPNRYPASTNSTTPPSPFPLINGPLDIAVNGGRFTTFGNSSNRVEFPGSNFNNGCYFVDVVFVPGVSLYSDQVPADLDAENSGTTYCLGTYMKSSVPGTVTHIRWPFPITAQPGAVAPKANVFRVSDGSKRGGADVAFSMPGRQSTTGAPSWNLVELDTPAHFDADELFCPTIWTPARYVTTGGLFGTGLTNGILSTDAVAGKYFENPSSGVVTFPESDFGNAGYFADVVFVPD